MARIGLQYSANNLGKVPLLYQTSKFNAKSSRWCWKQGSWDCHVETATRGFREMMSPSELRCKLLSPVGLFKLLFHCCSHKTFAALFQKQTFLITTVRQADVISSVKKMLIFLLSCNKIGLPYRKPQWRHHCVYDKFRYFRLCTLGATTIKMQCLKNEKKTGGISAHWQ